MLLLGTKVLRFRIERLYSHTEISLLCLHECRSKELVDNFSDQAREPYPGFL